MFVCFSWQGVEFGAFLSDRLVFCQIIFYDNMWSLAETRVGIKYSTIGWPEY